MNKLNKPKIIDIVIVSAIFGMITGLAFYIFPDTMEFKIKLIVILSIMCLGFIILFITQIIKLYKFYNEYEKQFNDLNKVIQTYESNNLNQKESISKYEKKIAKLEKDIKELKENSLPYDVVDEW